MLIVSIVFTGYYIYRYVSRQKIPTQVQGKQPIKNNNSTVVLLKTHVWTDDLEKFALKLKNETIPYGIDFYILMHNDDNQLPNKIKNRDLSKYVLTFSESEIRKVYSKGFFSMWLSNHWILMWFYKQHQNKHYEYFWTIEYDVRISGDSSKLWKYTGTKDFLYPVGPFKDKNWTFKHHYVGGKLSDKDKYYGYLQLARYSNQFLKFLDSSYTAGENGQDEMITFSLFKRGNFTGSDRLLRNLIKDSWSVDNTTVAKNKQLFDKSENDYRSDSTHLRIFHPIK